MNLGNRVAKVITFGTGIIESYLQRNLKTFVQALQSPVSEVITDICYLKKKKKCCGKMHISRFREVKNTP